SSELSNGVLQQIQQIVKQNPSLLDKGTEELETVLTTLAALPFKDEVQQANFLERVQRLEGNHIIQVFNLGVSPLQEYFPESSAEFLEEVIKLFEICFSFCYTTDVSKRVAFDYYVRALKFCFPSEPKQCLSTSAVCKLLELVQIFQEGKLAHIASNETESPANLRNLQFNGTSYLFGELLQIFESRRHDDYLVEIIEQTVRLASADANVKCIQQHAIGEVTLRNENVVSPVFVTNWMKLLKLTNVSNDFAVSLAKVDRLRCTERITPVPFFLVGLMLRSNLTYESTVCFFARVLEEMENEGVKVSFPNDKDRLDIFFNHLNHFNCNDRDVTVISLRLLAATSISNGVLREVLDKCFYKEMVPPIEVVVGKNALELLFKVLSLFPDGEVVKKVLTFWREAFSEDPGFQMLECLLSLFDEEASNCERAVLQERAERTLDFLEWLPLPIVRLISVWHRFFCCFIRIFPSTFHRRAEVLVFIHKAVRVPTEQRQAYFFFEQDPALPLLEWISQQSCTEEMKSEMIWLLMCSTDRAVGRNWVIDTGVIRSLALCPRLQFSTKKYTVRELNEFAPFFKELEEKYLKEFVEKVLSNETLEFMDELFFEFLPFIQRFLDKQRPSTIPTDVLKLLSLLSRVSISGTRRVKVIQMSKESGKGLLSGLRILQLVEMYQCVVKERTNEYFDLLVSVLAETLKGDEELCEIFYNQHRCIFPSTEVLKVWTTSVAELISLGSFKEDTESRCCCPVLQRAGEFSSPSEISQILTQVRSTAESVVHLSSQGIVKAPASRDFQPTSQGSSTEQTDPLENFVEALRIILDTDVLSSCEKMLLVKKVCDYVISTPDILTSTTLSNALTNLIPCTSWRQSTVSSIEELGVSQECRCIVTVMEHPTEFFQLSRRIPFSLNDSLSSVLFRKTANSFPTDNIVDIFLFIGSLKDLDQAFFDHLVPFLDEAIQESMSVKDVLELLNELVQFLRGICPGMIPITMLNFAYLLQNSVNKQERQQFLTELELAMKWELSPKWRVLSFLEVPGLLWKSYNSVGTPEKRCEMICRVQDIFKKSSKLEDWAMRRPQCFERREDRITRRIACCELEWLVSHSSLSTVDAALVFDLSCVSLQRASSVHHLRCFTFSDVQISEDGVFTFASQDNDTASEVSTAHVPVREIGSTCSVSAPTENGSPTMVPQSVILTPVLVAKEVIQFLKGVLAQDEEPSENAFALWDLVLSKYKPLFRCEEECTSAYSLFDDYIHVFLSILSEASSIEQVFHWARIDPHHACQCSKVILEACKWKGDKADKEDLLKLQSEVSTTLEKMRLSKQIIHRTPFGNVAFSVPCFRHLKPQLTHMRSLLESRLPFEVTARILALYQVNVQAGVTVGEIVFPWSCEQQSLELIENIQSFYKQDEMSSFNPAQNEFAWQLLNAFGRICMNSSEDLLVRLKELILLYDPDDAYGLNRLPKWRETTIADGFPVRAIDSWCAAFLMTPLEDLTSRDVDAIVDLNSHSLGLVTSVSQTIKRVIFPDDGFQVTQGKGIKESLIKERIRLARLLGEFINILKVRKPEENHKDAVIRDIVVDACAELCDSHKNNRKRNDLYKIHGQKLKALFTEIFGKRRKSVDGQASIQDCGLAHRGDAQAVRVAVSVARQSSYLHENLPSVLSNSHVYEPMLVLLRRWLSGIVTKPTLASHTLAIVQLLFSLHPSNAGPDLLEELHGIIQSRVLSLEENQSLVAQLQAAGYNQRREGIPDLWSSHVVELPCYLSKRENPSSRLFKKKLTEVLRRLWQQLKDILFRLGIPSIKVGEEEVCTKDLFGVQASLEEMEEQAATVKEVVKEIVKRINSEDLDRSMKQLMRQEQRHRARIEKLYKSNRSSVTCDEMKKFVAVWDNRFLEQVKLCSERIPGCYVPNGFHSEKPVLCALSVDNKILTVFKEEKPGRREEIENVEVKLFEAGMYVYGLHSSGHDYVTDELWAAFYKKLLEERLVPSIVLSNESPGFDWIKAFVQPATSHPWPWKWELHHGIVPRKEDYFDYLPISAALWPALHGLREFLTLTADNVSSFQFDDFKDVHTVEAKEKQTKEMAGKAIQELKRELHLLHGINEPIINALAGKLTFAVKETVKGVIDGEQPNEETVKKLIDMERLAFGRSEVERTEESRQQYAAAVLRACERAW
ncbi:uncharacterized protein LOC110052628, partial [Orbicella faveolata]|uniref:uncharacterized protein LOC110052628 n=2 Tax=Orbicella faveolata TaxID=48498 RepID=UPI0009E5341A